MIRLGITGQVGTGKSLAAGFFEKLGAKRISADELAHDLTRRGGKCFKKIEKAFGVKVLNNKSEIDRKALGKLVFASPAKRRILNGIVHPEVIKEIKRLTLKAGKKSILAIEIPLLIECRLFKLVDAVIVVDCPRKTQLARLAGAGIANTAAKKMIKSQLPMKEKLKYADFVVDNGGSKARTRAQVKFLLDRIKKIDLRC